MLKSKICQTYTFFHIWGGGGHGGGGPYVKPKVTKCSRQYDIITEQIYV